LAFAQITPSGIIYVLYGTVYTPHNTGGGRPYPYSVFSVSKIDRYYTVYVRRVYAIFCIYIPFFCIIIRCKIPQTQVQIPAGIVLFVFWSQFFSLRLF